VSSHLSALDRTPGEKGDSAVFGLRHDYRGEVLFTLHNLSPHQTTMKATEMGELSYLVDVFSDTAYGRPDPDAPDPTISG